MTLQAGQSISDPAQRACVLINITFGSTLLKKLILNKHIVNKMLKAILIKILEIDHSEIIKALNKPKLCKGAHLIKDKLRSLIKKYINANTHACEKL